MSENSSIEWTDHTFNTHCGCSKISPRCDNCYAQSLARRFGFGWGDTAIKREFNESLWNELLRRDRKARREGGHRRVFTNSMFDLFGRFAPAGVRERHWRFVARTPDLDHLLLTKRVGNVRRMVPTEWLRPGWWPANVWMGANIVNQDEADRDIPKLLARGDPLPELGATPGDRFAETRMDAAITRSFRGWRKRAQGASYASGLGIFAARSVCGNRPAVPV